VILLKCNIRGLQINYEVFGSGKPILILNSNGTDMRSMIYCIEPLFNDEGEWMRIYIDQPGVGGTKAAEWINNSDDMLDIILDFTEIVIPKKSFSVAGRSYGGYLALGILKKRPELLNGMLLICPGIFMGEEVRDIDKNIEDVFNVDLEVEKRIEERIRKELAEATEATDAEFMDRLRKNLKFSFTVSEFERSFNKPVLIIAGKQDDVMGYRDSFNLLNNFPRATYCVLDKASHIPQIEQEGLFSALVKEWLYRVDEEIKRM
jgi:pimeloyl-ACP methyl ester carboxylesterase